MFTWVVVCSSMADDDVAANV